MFLKRIKDQHHHITKLIGEKKLKESFVELNEFIAKTNNWDLQNKLKEIETSYSYMLDYMRQDIADPKRTEMHQKLLRDTLAIADKACLLNTSLEPYRTSYFKTLDKLKSEDTQYTLDTIQIELEAYTENYAVAGLLKNQDSTEQLNNVRKRHEEIQSTMFSMIWTSQYWTDEEEAVAKRMLESVLITENDLCLFVSAVTLGLLENFDSKKLMLLFDAYNHENNQINQRALVGLVLAFQSYHTRLPFYPEVVARLSHLNENEAFAKSLNRIQIQILLSKDTDKINKKMQEEIIPEMIKNANSHNLRINPDENEEDFNPDWVQNIENSAFGDKLREMSELQMEGADVYMSTFAYHKGYRFFQTINNWFYPFDKQHSLVVSELGDGTGSNVIDLILESAFFCDSDKYSLLFTIMQIPASHREMMTRQLSEQQLDELMNEKSDSMKAFSGRPELISNQYIHNIYRFFKLFKFQHEFLDIFEEPIHLNEYPVLKEIMYKPQLLKDLVNFLFRKAHYSEATEVYNLLLKLEDDNAEVYQKLGYCHQKQKQYAQALSAYSKADMLKPDNVWTNRHMATCYRMMNDYAKATVYYKKVEQVQPENRSLLYNTGSCLVELGQFDEALQYFFKLDFIEPDNLRTWRAIGWCSFMLKKLEQARKFYDKIIEKNGVAPDYLNAGHVVWCLGDMKKAMEFYSKSCELSGSRALFLDVFNKDKEFLLENGVNTYDIALMYDLI
ncbi:hypothetical protein D0T87_20220 [Bacteroides sp. 51]|nr:hypothetical protein [Bacteroides sp. 51]